ncbi:MAG: hypothetical protein OXH84_08865 [Gammaproteobacteria bacterium]|nr:hypothetical protein [Gammaproteobacteria bacterium]
MGRRPTFIESITLSTILSVTNITRQTQSLVAFVVVMLTLMLYCEEWYTHNDSVFVYDPPLLFIDDAMGE